MYHPVKDQELHPEKYILTSINPNILEDDCHDLLSKPRQTQTTIGLYLKKADPNHSVGESSSSEECQDSPNRLAEKNFSILMREHVEKCIGVRNRILTFIVLADFPRVLPFRFNRKCRTVKELIVQRDFIKPDPKKDNYLEKLVEKNKGFWIDKPTLVASLIHKLNEHHNVELPTKKGPKKSQGIFYRPEYFELDYLIELGQKGLLYSDEEMSDTEEVEPDLILCQPLRKKRYKICDPCKPKAEKRETYEKVEGGDFRTIKKIPTGCQCDYYGEHNNPPKVWDSPFRDEEDMIRQHEMNKYLRPYKAEILRKYSAKITSASFKIREPGAKRTFPTSTLTNL